MRFLEEYAAFGISSMTIFPALVILFTCDRLQNNDEKMDLQQLWLSFNGVAISTDYFRTTVRPILCNWLEDLFKNM